MNDTQQKQLGSTLWAIADKLRGAMNADDFRDYMLEAQSPVVPRLKRSRCRSSQEVNDSPTPFSALNYC